MGTTFGLSEEFIKQLEGFDPEKFDPIPFFEKGFEYADPDEKKTLQNLIDQIQKTMACAKKSILKAAASGTDNMSKKEQKKLQGTIRDMKKLFKSCSSKNK